jgi:hypothetical protein
MWEKHTNSEQKSDSESEINCMHTIILRKNIPIIYNLQFFFTVFAGGGSRAFSAAAILATLLANAVKAV